ncbi:ABC-2 type transport system permease protein [Kineococcus xinjiangensis]|uniref:Transport permease protein n=1 Tax=Kineococcus xinjiangensis TaxID=512762 RepID=A0A2S6ITZ0_9ACTN|nr:ABC transporter permease [Kineococcus xinjiangensis]PPK97688.1 ABC-2 type transport system permease protein [Kineococcus xinjiangensis]
MNAVLGALADGSVVAKRNLIHIKRVPDLLIGTLISPIMFILLFAYVFGSAIPAPDGVNYREWLVPGIFAQTVIFGGTITGMGLATDMQKGIIDRFRSLPMAQPAVLIGRTSSDVVTNILTIAIMAATGLAVGWRIRTSIPEAVLGFALLLLFAYAVSWAMAYIGLLVRTPEAFQSLTFLTVFPVTFIANTFVPIDNFPTVLKVVADWNPVSSLVLATRELFGNVGPAGLVRAPEAWSLQHPVAYTLIWVALILLVFVPVASRQYKRATSR